VKQIKEELEQKTKELNTIRKKGNQYHKNYNVMKQMYKTNESKVRSLENESKKNQKALEKKETKCKELKEGLLGLIKETKKLGKKRNFIKEIIGKAISSEDIDEIYDYDIPIDTLMDRDFDVNSNLRAIKQEFDSKQFQFNEDEVAEFENEIQGLAGLDSTIFDNQEVHTPMNLSMMSLENDSMFKKKEIADENEFEDSEKINKKIRTEKTEEFKQQMKKEIEDKIKSRVSLILGKSSQRKVNVESSSKSNLKENVIDQVEMQKESILEFTKNINFKIQKIMEAKCDQITGDILSKTEIQHLKTRIGVVENIEEFVGWLFQYLTEILKKSKSDLNAVLSEKSKSFLSI
jgi:hypothetical protein